MFVTNYVSFFLAFIIASIIISVKGQELCHTACNAATVDCNSDYEDYQSHEFECSGYKFHKFGFSFGVCL